jgi:integrase
MAGIAVRVESKTRAFSANTCKKSRWNRGTSCAGRSFRRAIGCRLRRATWLTFRRTYSTWSHDKGVPGKVVAQLMGHAHVDTTLNIYTQVLDGSVRDAAEKVGRELITIVHSPESAMTLSH